MRDPVLAQIVGRCHVGDSNREVIAYVISRLRKGYATWRTLPKPERRRIMRAIVKEHRENQQLYITVMGGRL